MPGAIVARSRVLRHVEMFSHVVLIEGGERLVVQLRQSWWLHDDGSYCVAMHRADDPLICEGSHGNDPERRCYLDSRYVQVRKLALGISESPLRLSGD